MTQSVNVVGSINKMTTSCMHKIDVMWYCPVQYNIHHPNRFNLCKLCCHIHLTQKAKQNQNRNLSVLIYAQQKEQLLKDLLK